MPTVEGTAKAGTGLRLATFARRDGATTATVGRATAANGPNATARAPRTATNAGRATAQVRAPATAIRAVTAGIEMDATGNAPAGRTRSESSGGHDRFVTRTSRTVPQVLVGQASKPTALRAAIRLANVAARVVLPTSLAGTLPKGNDGPAIDALDEAEGTATAVLTAGIATGVTTVAPGASQLASVALVPTFPRGSAATIAAGNQR